MMPLRSGASLFGTMGVGVGISVGVGVAVGSGVGVGVGVLVGRAVVSDCVSCVAGASVTAAGPGIPRREVKALNSGFFERAHI